MLEHADGTRTTYTAPLSELITTGTRVLRGEWLGRLASSDRPASELRFAWQRAGAAIDPSPVLIGP